ncbi:hypothetical protein Back2_08770 [Nocardioides baekrokdamisoli]|uniref:Sporulation stage II protein D amidase enhancer LytB N-terminal domain-containing protein n=1 Tax=Nocardioides baekrokdamisoli TaxID=1804624 RepID=A0A3G9ICD0_9ACTN|nr:SpoIID/LytB domain-containing protein [Nocardioides baekrokdamisoli]BBH16590.1 hypothetical protein Back2_08770 [Nocardioides baekrokdamisoli]
MIRRRSRAVVAALAAAVATLFSPSSAQAYTASQHMVISGHGWGHGHGMSQYGARGAAIKGLDYKQILGFYYPHTTWSTKTGLVRVLLAGITTNKVVARPRSSLTASWRGHTSVWNLGKVQPTADQWQIVPASGGRSVLMYHVAAGWKTYTAVVGELDFYALGNPISIGVPGGWRSYRGTVGAVLPSPSAATRWIVNTLQLDQYILGVIPSEMPSSWQPEALKAQAVAARTYAAFEMATPASPEYDLFDDTRSQVYGGFTAEQASTNTAASATTGQILMYGGKPAFTEFSSSNGGYELAASTNPQPYLPSQPDPYEQYSGNPYATWSASISVTTLLNECPSAGSSITSVTAEHYPPSNNPWLSRVIVKGPSGSCTFYGYQFRVMNGLRSANMGFHIS